jgi:hypothetical protein
MTTKEKLQLSRIWWKGLTLENKFYKVIPWLRSKGENVTTKHPDELTEAEVLEIWKSQKL